MKKLFSIALLAVFASIIVGCDKGAETAPSAAPATTNAPAAK
jgi:hypothetical protein